MTTKSSSVFLRTAHDGSIKHAEHELYHPPKRVLEKSHLPSMSHYKQMYDQSVQNPVAFWSKIAQQFFWDSFEPNQGLEWNFDSSKGPISINWFKGARTNVSYNCLDRHIKNGNGDKTVFYWSKVVS
ncbi:acetyl-coenzyme A synthetase-like [Octopus sinensis]|uniref:Acetyl-coenzyme A synthetase-like n=1 Tax=Octopus sinensis TaxID=2607531 RepID=A0A6P7U6C3_9MOLL|nr:acetyl-coenzyme A synthetase-like [Octopus sinensis]